MHDDFFATAPDVLCELPREEDPPTVIVGLAPATSGAPPWDPAAGSTRRLAELADCHPYELPRFFALTNLLSSWVGEEAGYRAARRAAETFALVPGFRYLVVGATAFKAFGCRVLPLPDESVAAWSASASPLLRWYRSRDGVEVGVAPHPSGRNRWYNVPQRRVAAGRFFRGARWRGEGRAHDLWCAATGTQASTATP